MSGQAGAMGYTYQAIVAILNACKNEEWKYISVECDTEDDKVDIGLYNADQRIIKAIQVKSTTNQFSKSDIFKWIQLLIADVEKSEKAAEHILYALELVGACDKKAGDFCKAVTDFCGGKMNKGIETQLAGYSDYFSGKNVAIFRYDNKKEALLPVLRDSIYDFLDRIGYEKVAYKNLKLIASGLIGEFSLHAITGRLYAKEEYIALLIEWLTATKEEPHVEDIQELPHTELLIEVEQKQTDDSNNETTKEQGEVASEEDRNAVIISKLQSFIEGADDLIYRNVKSDDEHFTIWKRRVDNFIRTIFGDGIEYRDFSQYHFGFFGYDEDDERKSCCKDIFEVKAQLISYFEDYSECSPLEILRELVEAGKDLLLMENMSLANESFIIWKKRVERFLRNTYGDGTEYKRYSRLNFGFYDYWDDYESSCVDCKMDILQLNMQLNSYIIDYCDEGDLRSRLQLFYDQISSLAENKGRCESEEFLEWYYNLERYLRIAYGDSKQYKDFINIEFDSYAKWDEEKQSEQYSQGLVLAKAFIQTWIDDLDFI